MLKMIIIENKNNVIYTFGRNEKNISYKKTVPFYSYFWTIDDKGEGLSIDDKKLKKINLSDTKEIFNITKSKNYYEFDVAFTNRYLIDEVKEIKKEPIRVCYFDIETEIINAIDIVNTPNKILSICCYDNFLNKYIVFVLGNCKLKNTTEKSYYNFSNEKDLLTKFIEFIQDTDPDILTAWNGDNFDFPYIINRINKIGLNANKLSRMNYTSYKRNAIIKGRILFDLMYGYKKISQGERENYSLNYISNYEFGEGKEKYEGNLEDLYNKNIDKYVNYNIRDVELLLLLDNKLKIIDFFDEIRRFAFCHFNDVLNNSKIVDTMVLKEAKKKNLVLPSKSINKDTVIEGAYVKQPVPGLHDNIAVLDMKSLYPSIMISFNLGYETILDKKQDDCINIDDKYYYTKKEGLLKQILNNLLNIRSTVKEEMNKHDKNTIEYKQLDLKQYAIKVIANSFYGVIGYNGFRLFNSKVAETITYLGRKFIHYVIDKLEYNGIAVIYSDTDSVFIKMKNKNINDIKQITKEINKSFDDFVKQFNITEHLFVLEFEKVYKKILFTKAKKRYAGKLVWKDGKENNDLNIMGFSTKRSDCPQIARDFEKELFNLILTGADKKDILKHISNFKKEIRTCDPSLIGLPIGISKSISSYTNMPIHIRAANNSNKLHNTNFSENDKIKYIYVLNEIEVIAFQDKLPGNYKIDYDKMETRLINNDILEVLNPQTSNLGDFI